ncbi:PAS-domain containing protein [Paracoccus bogoriensis]|uniref:hybrid sensor histidine kinase/response regulator n=1 Tax=Paracoccus bogoriensis TaxID=242065 RepID=UPI001CA47157|nr:PAS-domain containing protein [Paracoccus bogoriensis]MBW7056218.1 PAS-domain containing protein [Paracoccus bogoriensis]
MTRVPVLPDLPADIEAMLRPGDDPARRHEKLVRIVQSLIRQIEDLPDDHGAGYAQFQRAAVLEEEVRARTEQLEHALDLLNASNAQLSAALAEKEAARRNLASAIETMHEGFALFDASDVMVMCNSRFNALLPDIRDRLSPGLTFEEYLALAASSRHLVLPEGMTRAGWIEMRRRRHAERHFILTQGMADGRLVQVSEQRTGDGGTAIIQTEVTELVRAERALRGRMLDDQAAILQATLEHLPLGVCLFDGGLRLLGWNSNLSQMLALPLPRLRRGMHFDELWQQIRRQFVFPAGQGAHSLLSWARSVRRKESYRTEVTLGAGRTLAIFAQEIPDGGFVMSLDDITDHKRALYEISRANETLETRVQERTMELKDALARAERANASRARFVAAVGHDLMQPLSAATLYVGSLMEEIAGAGPRAKLDKIQRSLDSVSGLIEALLDISRLEAGQAALTIEPVALAPMLEQLRAEFAPLAEQKGLELVLRPARATVLSDRTYLRRILQNLISNAIRYTDRGRVMVAVRMRGDRLLVQVRDSGRGIAEKDHQVIFAEFRRLDAKASAAEGLGLGLAIVDRAASLLGHRLSLRSAPGRGSTFSVEMATTRQGASDALAGPVAAAPAQALCLTALIVENDQGMTQALTQLLEQWGVDVLDVTSGEEAVALIEETGVEPDLCLCDYQLGAGMDGLECLKALAGMLPPHSGRWLMTANRADALAQEAAALSVELLTKPILPATLARIVMAAGRQARPVE